MASSNISLTYGELLRGNRSFRRLLAGQVASELGNWFNFIAALGLVRLVTDADATATAAILVARLLPFALFAPLAGALVDRLSRRRVMILSDLGRGVVTLGFLFVHDKGDLPLAVICTVAGTMLAALFEGARNAAVANIVGREGMLAGNALMFSSRFLLMSIGAAAGGAIAAWIGYEAAFVVNALAFVASALFIRRVPEAATRSSETEDAVIASSIETPNAFARVWRDLREGWAYILSHRLVAAVLGANIMWALGGGMLNLLYDRLGGVEFAAEGWKPDTGVALLYSAAGAGALVGMLCAQPVGGRVERRGRVSGFIGWTLIAHGAIFALTGLMPTLWLAALMVFLSRILIGVEFAMQETLVMRLLPDDLRGRVFTTDRAAEIGVMSLATAAAGASLGYISPRTLCVISGLLAGLPGVVWLALFRSGYLRLEAHAQPEAHEPQAVLAAS